MGEAVNYVPNLNSQPFPPALTTNDLPSGRTINQSERTYEREERWTRTNNSRTSLIFREYESKAQSLSWFVRSGIFPFRAIDTAIMRFCFEILALMHKS